jgi:hypothetical protein
MTTASNMLVRSLVTYALVLPLALVLGYLLATPLDFSTLATVGLVCMVLCLPLVLKWHRPILFLSWNLSATMFFLPGRPELWMGVAAASLTIAIIQRTLLQQMRFIFAPSVTLPLLFLAAVVIGTGYLTGSFGLKAFGSKVMGAKSYLFILAGIAGVFAMIAYRIPRQSAMLYTALFFLGSAANSIGMLAPYVPSWCYPIFLLFPVSFSDIQPLMSTGFETNTRLESINWVCSAITYYLLARYGIKRMLQRGNILRLCLLIVVVALTLFGGYRGRLISLCMTFAFLFFFEGLFRSKYAFVIVAGCLLTGLLVVPFADKMPFPIQRSLSFLPVNVDPAAREEAERSSEWRVQMWSMVIPEIPKYFWLGKGVGISLQEMDIAEASHQSVEDTEVANMLVGNYHNGPLSVLMNFGVWGAIGFLWFVATSLRALYINYRYGESYLKQVNTFVLALFAAKVVMFLFVFGDFRLEFAQFTGLVGLNLALNHGIRKPVRTKAQVSIPIRTREPLNLSPGMPS